MTHRFAMPIKTVSRSNARMHWAAKARLTKAEREAAYLFTRDQLNRGWKPGTVKRVSMVRYGLKELDNDNLAASLKAVRDGIAQALGLDDGPRTGIAWEYGQERVRKREQIGVLVMVQ